MSLNRRRPASHAGSLLLALACPGCFGTGPTAARIRPDTNDRYLPQRDIHFVEHRQRSKGVLVSATAGFPNAFSAAWTAVLVPTPPTPLPPPTWTGRSPSRDLARELAALPPYRKLRDVADKGNMARSRLEAPSVWVLVTDPFVLGLPDGPPKLSWCQFAANATGVSNPEQMLPIQPFVARYVVDEELDQPLSALIVYPANFWDGEPGARDITVVTLPTPLRIDEVLDTLTRRDPLQLGTAKVIPLQEPFTSSKELGQRRAADRERLMNAR